MFSLITKYSTFAGIFKLIFLVIIFIVIILLQSGMQIPVL